MMSAFLNSGLLWFLPLAAVPLILHLLTLHRLRTVELSTFRFLFDSYVQQRRRMRFLEALLAMLRVAAILFLVLAIARPVVQHWDGLFGKGSGRDVVMLVDCSASMNARGAGTSALERAKTVADKVAKSLSGDDRLTLIRVAAQPQEVFSRFSSDAEAISAHIESLSPTPSRANFFAALQHVFGPQAGKRTKPEVYIFTDCQSSGWREVRDQRLGELVPADAKINIVNVGSPDMNSNRAVVGTAPPQPRAIVGLPVVLKPRVVNFSPDETLEVPVSVIVGEKEVARTTLQLKPNESRSREVIYVPQEPGVLQARFEIPTGTSSDRFPDDDTYLFTLHVAPQVKILLVSGSPPTVDPFENEALYLRTALSAVEGGGGSGDLLPKQEFLRSLDVHEISEPQLTADLLKDARVVVLANCGGLNDQQFTWLRDYTRRGGGLLILPGDKVNPATYNDRFFPAGGPQKERLIAARLAPAVGDAEKAATFERIASVDYSHPVLGVFDDPDARYLNSAYFFRRFPLELDTAAGSCWPLAEFTNGDPALLEGQFGQGLVQLAAFPANTKWSNLALKPEFVPLVLRLANHLQYRPDLEVPGVVGADTPAEIAISEEWYPAEGMVSSVNGGSTKIDFKRAGARLLGAYEGTSEKGYYSVTVRTGNVPEPRGQSLFAVNLAPEESRFEIAQEQQFRDWLPQGTLQVVDASAEAAQLHGEVGGRREVWRPLIFLMFLIVIVEFLLATLGGQRTDGEETITLAERLKSWTPGSWVGRMTGASASAES